MEELGLKKVRAEVCLANLGVCVWVCVRWGSLSSTWVQPGLLVSSFLYLKGTVKKDGETFEQGLLKQEKG